MNYWKTNIKVALNMNTEFTCIYCNGNLHHMIEKIKTVVMKNHGEITGKYLCCQCNKIINYKASFTKNLAHSENPFKKNTVSCYFCNICARYCPSTLFSEINI